MAAEGVRKEFIDVVSRKTGVPAAYVPLMSMVLSPTLRSWMQTAERFAAEHLVDEVVVDLGNAIGAQQLLTGGQVTYQEGKTVRVSFRKISR
jgi:hypothetical protein